MSSFFPAKKSGQIDGVQCYTAREVKGIASGYVVVVKVEGGWKAFDDVHEYDVWRKAKRSRRPKPD